MAVIGTGTQADPYIVNNWTDFCSVKDEAGKYIFWEDLPTDQKIVDLNEEVPEGYTGYFTIASRKVDFNGWTIRNLSIYAPNATAPIDCGTGTHTIKNGKFLNCNFSAHVPFGAMNGSALEDCVITGTFNSTGYHESSDRPSARYTAYIRCAINMNVNIHSSGYTDWQPMLINSVVRLNVISQKSSGDAFGINYNNATYDGKNTATHDSKIILDLSLTAESGANNIAITCSGNNVFIVKSDVKTTFAAYSTYTKVSLVRSDNPNDVYSSTLYKSVTDEQLKDPDYLYSLGFPIATGVGS